MYLLDYSDWWEYIPNQGASWYWRQICAKKEKIKLVYTQTDLCSMQQY